jgi:hypothetical protein
MGERSGGGGGQAVAPSRVSGRGTCMWRGASRRRAQPARPAGVVSAAELNPLRRFRNPGRGPHRHTVRRCTVPRRPVEPALLAGRASHQGAEGSSRPPAGHHSRRGPASDFGRRDSAAGQHARPEKGSVNEIVIFPTRVGWSVRTSDILGAVEAVVLHVAKDQVAFLNEELHGGRIPRNSLFAH